MRDGLTGRQKLKDIILVDLDGGRGHGLRNAGGL